MILLRQDLAMALLFGIGYAGIIFEESLAFNKSGVGLLMAVSLWVIRSIGVRFILFAYLPKLILLLYLSSFFYLKCMPSSLNICNYNLVQAPSPDIAVSELTHASAEVSEIVFFLLGAMTIVEIVDAHQGFKLVTDNITTRKPRTLLWVVSVVFLLSWAY
jgi:hypothetical protein